MGGGSSKKINLNESEKAQKSIPATQLNSPEMKQQKKTFQFKQALSSLKNQQFLQALELLNKTSPITAEVHYLKGLSYLGLNDLKQAQLHFEEAIKLESNYLNALAEIGNIQILEGKYVEASNTFTKMIEINEKSFEGHFGLAFINSYLNNHKISEEYYEKALIYRENDKNALLNYGHLLAKQKKIDQAIEKYKDALKKDPNHIEAIISITKVLLQQKKYDEVLDFCKSYELSNNKKIKLIIQNCQSQALFELKKYKNSSQLCQEILEQAPKNQEALFNMGMNFFCLDEFEKAQIYFNLILQENPQHIQALKMMAKIFAQVQNDQQLIQLCDKILLHDCSDLQFYEHRANALFRMKEYERALDDFNIVIQQNEKNINVQKKRCECQIQLKEFLLAISCCEQIMKLITEKSDKIDILFLKGQCHLEANQIFSAKTTFDQVLQMDPKNEQLILKIANAYRDCNNFQSALPFYDKLLKMKPKVSLYHAEKAQYYIKQNNIKEALELLKSAIQLEPNNPTYRIQRAKLHISNQQIDDAIKDYKEASQLNLNDSKIYFELGQLYQMQSDFEQSQNMFRKAIELDPDNQRYHVKLALEMSMNDQDDEVIDDLKNTLSIHPDFEDCQHLLETISKKPQHIKQYTQMFVFVVISLLQVGIIDETHTREEVLITIHNLMEQKLKIKLVQNPQIFEIIRIMIVKKYDYIVFNNQKEIKKVLSGLYKNKFKNNQEFFVSEILEVAKKIAKLKENQLKQVILATDEFNNFMELCGNIEELNNPVSAIALQDALALLTILILTSNKLIQGQQSLKNQIFEIIKNGSLGKLKQK